MEVGENCDRCGKKWTEAPLPASSPQADTDDHAAAILQSVLMMIGLPGFKAEWFVDGKWDLGEIRRYGLDDRLAEIRKAESQLKAQQGEPAASSPAPQVEGLIKRWRARSENLDKYGRDTEANKSEVLVLKLCADELEALNE